MANICEYKVLVKGKRNACYAFFGSMSCLDGKYIAEEEGSNDNYTLRFEGTCKWSVDSYCSPWEGDFPVELPADHMAAYEKAEELYWYKTVQERSRMFEVEVYCNSADIDDFCGVISEHYINGEMGSGEFPEGLEIEGDLEEGDINYDMVMSMLEDDVDPDIIVDITGISMEELQELMEDEE